MNSSDFKSFSVVIWIGCQKRTSKFLMMCLPINYFLYDGTVVGLNMKTEVSNQLQGCILGKNVPRAAAIAKAIEYNLFKVTFKVQSNLS
jgi:hypothetical protein